MAVKRHAKRWRADWRDEFGIRRRKDFDLKADAENFEREQRQKARDGKTGEAPAAHPNITLSEYATTWLANRTAQGIDPATTARNEIDLRRHILPRFGTTRVREIRRTSVKAFLLSKLADGESAQGVRPGREEKRTTRKLARGSVLSLYHTLSAILSEAVEDRLIQANPIRGLWKRLSKGAKTEPNGQAKVKALDADQAREFLTAAKVKAPDHFAYVATLMWAGLRPGEGLALTADKLDLTGRTALIDRQVGQHGGLKSTKTGDGRNVDLSTRLVEVLDEVIRERIVDAAVAKATGRPLGPWMFYPDLGPNPTEKDAQRVYKRALNGMRRALEAAGLPTHFGLHSLRHTFGSGLIAAGVSPAYVQQQMGHASIQQTVDTYGSWLPIRVPGAVDALAEATAPTYAGRRGHQMDTNEVSERVGVA